MHVLDSSALIELLHDTPKGKKIIRLIGAEPALTTVFSIHELLKGASGPYKQAVQHLLTSIEVLEYDKESAILSSDIYKILSKKGGLINETDILIAGICLKNGSPLVTLDNHFKRIPGLNTTVVL